MTYLEFWLRDEDEWRSLNPFLNDLIHVYNASEYQWNQKNAERTGSPNVMSF